MCELRRIKIYNWNARIYSREIYQGFESKDFFSIENSIENLDLLLNS